jgi:hypothetical protein
MMNRIGDRNEERIRSPESWVGIARWRLPSRRTVQRVRAVGGFGGRDGRDCGALLEGARAVARWPVPPGGEHPAHPG